MVLFEKEVCEALRLPSIPKKKWDSKSSFSKCVAVVNTLSGLQAYAVASFDADKEEKPRIVKVFSQEPFNEVVDVFVVPEYMNIEDIKDADLDDESKKRAEELAKEAHEIEEEGVEDGVKAPEHEYYFEHITNDDEAAAFIKSYNQTNKLRARVPKTHDGLIMRLSVIWSETNKQ